MCASCDSSGSRATREAPAAGLEAGWRKRTFAWLLHRINVQYEQAMAPRKRSLFAGLEGTVLEIGPGTGVNLPYYAAWQKTGGHWIGIEPNPYMRNYLRREAERLGMQAELRIGHGERLDAENASVDAVVGTLVLCSVKDVAKVLSEIRRVLKPGGRFFFIEHVAAPAGTRTRTWQRRLRPVFRFLADGCCIDRETWKPILDAGFGEVQLEHFRAPAPISIMAPHIAGVAVK